MNLSEIQESIENGDFSREENRELDISAFFVDKTPLEDEKTYIVATSDHLQRGHAYLSLAECELIKYHPDFLKDILETHATSIENRKKARKRRIKFPPQ